MKTVRERILDESKGLICGDREQDYGSPIPSFERIALLWSAYLEVDVSALDVAQMMTLLKISRSKTSQTKMDNYVDGVGYQALAAEIACNDTMA